MFNPIFEENVQGGGGGGGGQPGSCAFAEPELLMKRKTKA